MLVFKDRNKRCEGFIWHKTYGSWKKYLSLSFILSSLYLLPPHLSLSVCVCLCNYMLGKVHQSLITKYFLSKIQSFSSLVSIATLTKSVYVCKRELGFLSCYEKNLSRRFHGKGGWPLKWCIHPPSVLNLPTPPKSMNEERARADTGFPEIILN